ncbi:MAG TPA: class I SAM-dependent methyltransferase [Bacteroidota bacterium]|nr:class I SAM-dependent methyltransferase [Bacteroidota bacterium]
MTGQCNICGWKGEFLPPDASREGVLCGNCASTSRLRAVVYWLSRVTGNDGLALHEWPPRRSFAILESSARGAYPVMLSDKFDYYATEFDPEKIASGADRRHYADFQKLHFAGESFDVVIASDVFEHVRDDRAGYAEILRTLKPGGTLILTVPYAHEQKETIRRVDTSGEKDTMLLEPEYHGGGGHTLTYRNYGRDLLSLLQQTGFSVLHSRCDIPSLGITPQSVIIAQKAPYLDLSSRTAICGPMRALGPLVPYRMFILLKFNYSGFTRLVKQLLHS